MSDIIQDAIANALLLIGGKMDSWHWRVEGAGLWVERLRRTCGDCDLWEGGECAYNVETTAGGKPCCEFERRAR